jgi:hypothetical protein
MQTLFLHHYDTFFSIWRGEVRTKKLKVPVSNVTPQSQFSAQLLQVSAYIDDQYTALALQAEYDLCRGVTEA